MKLTLVSLPLLLFIGWALRWWFHLRKEARVQEALREYVVKKYPSKS